MFLAPPRIRERSIGGRGGRGGGGGPVVRARRVPSERLRSVSKSHLTLTWGGVMKQHDLRFAAPCSCLIETSVAHPPFHFGVPSLSSRARTHARTRVTIPRSVIAIIVLRRTKRILPLNRGYADRDLSRFTRVKKSLSLSLARARMVETFSANWSSPRPWWTRSRRPNGWGRHPGRYELCSGARHTGKFRRKSLWKVSFAPRERTSY